MKIAIRQCGGDYDEKRYAPRAATVASMTEDEIIDLAVTKLYGRTASLWRDNGLRDQGIYGQIVKPVPPKWGGGNTCVTGRVEVIIK